MSRVKILILQAKMRTLNFTNHNRQTFNRN